jgi:hypothetical protein
MLPVRGRGGGDHRRCLSEGQESAVTHDASPTPGSAGMLQVLAGDASDHDRGAGGQVARDGQGGG